MDRVVDVDPDPAVVRPGTVLFADGVRRIDARVWVHGSRPQPVPGIAASFAAGLVSCDGAARISAVAVERGLFTAAAEAAGITAGRVSYPARLAAGPAFDQLSLALQQRLTSAEVQLALTYRTQNPAADDLLIIDGPLRGRSHLDRAVGYIKTHHASYLPPEQAAVVSALRPGSGPPRSPWAPRGGAPPGTSSCRAPRACPGRASSGSNARPTCRFPR